MSKAKPLDQREHRIRPTVVDIGAYKKRDIPKLKGRYLKITKEWWEDFWNSDLASAVDTKSDQSAVYRLATLIDERERVYKQAKKERLVVGSQGQVVLNPLYSAMLKLDAEIRQLEDRIGMNPKARVSLGISIGQAKKSLSDLNAELEEE
jgi:P27 family predicted phage terminase small subunit